MFRKSNPLQKIWLIFISYTILVENKNVDFDPQDKQNGLYNGESLKVLTYVSTEGSHMVGEEGCILDEAVLPALCNIASAKRARVYVNSARVSTKGQIRPVTDDVANLAEATTRSRSPLMPTLEADLQKARSGLSFPVASWKPVMVTTITTP